MAQPGSKRARPAFSPPRPRSKKPSNGVSTSKTATETSRSRPTLTNKSKRKQRPATPVMSESDDEDAEASPPPADDPELSPSSAGSQSQEPEFMLVEITHDTSEPAIPLPLLHRILQHHFQDKDKTRISTDAREVLGTYVEVLVREAIMRASYKGDEPSGADGDDSGVGIGKDSGWLEVEDLEKVGAQLCLDF